MMKVSDVIFDVDILLENKLQLGVKLRWLNQIRRQLYRELPFDESVYAFETVAGDEFLDLPADCPQDTITHIVIGGVPYPKKQRIDRNLPAHYWLVVAGGCQIHPNPQKVEEGFVYYKATPPDLTEDDLEEEMDFSSDYHDGVFVSGLAVKVAKATKEMKVAREYEITMKETITQMKRDMKRNDILTVRAEPRR